MQISFISKRKNESKQREFLHSGKRCKVRQIYLKRLGFALAFIKFLTLKITFCIKLRQIQQIFTFKIYISLNFEQNNSKQAHFPSNFAKFKPQHKISSYPNTQYTPNQRQLQF
jgi:hypothetical protein